MALIRQPRKLKLVDTIHFAGKPGLHARGGSLDALFQAAHAHVKQVKTGGTVLGQPLAAEHLGKMLDAGQQIRQYLAGQAGHLAAIARQVSGAQVNADTALDLRHRAASVSNRKAHSPPRFAASSSLSAQP